MTDSNFFTSIYGDNREGFAAMMTRSENGRLDSERFFAWPRTQENMDRVAEMRANEDVYYSVSLFTQKKRTQKDEDAVTKVVWADADICPPESFRLPPSIVVQTSPAHGPNEECPPRTKTGKPCHGHYHVLWQLDRYYKASEVENAARQIAYAHRDEGCDLGWTMTKILRVPETVNTKFDPPFRIPPADITGRIYTLDEISEAYSDVEDIDSTDVSFIGDMPDLLDLSGLEKYVTEAGLEDLYLMSPRQGESWSERAYRFQMDLFRYGLSNAEVFTLAENAACNKYNPLFAGQLTQQGEPIPLRSDPLGTLWREVQKVEAEYLNEKQSIAAYSHSTSNDSSVSLLSDDENQLIRDTPTFIDEYTNWVLSRHPDADENYIPASAWMVLSNTYGNLCYFDSLHGPMFPNLWVIIAGPSSVGHKSSVLNRVIEITHAVEEQNLTIIDIGADATAEKLVTLLGTRDKEVSFLHIEEIAGFFRETITKNYRAGTVERFTDMYDGRVPVVHRSSEGKGNTNRASTVFNLFGVGVDKNIVSTLSRKDFSSGFLIRSMWSLGSPREYSRGDLDVENNPHDVNYGDPVFHGLVRELVQGQTRSDVSAPLYMQMDEEAKNRLNEFTHQLALIAIAEQDDVLRSGVERLRDSVVRCATLLSFHNGLKSIGLFEILVAIQQGERWFRDLRLILAEVSNSSFGRVCDELEKFIELGANGQRTPGAIYKKFGFRPNEYRDATEALKFQGRIRLVPKKGTWEVLS